MELSPLDNEISLLYKWAFKEGVPIRYVIVRPSDQDPNEINGLVFTKLEDYIRSQKAKGKTLQDIDMILRDDKITFYIDVLIMLYIKIRRSENIPTNIILEELQAYYNYIDTNKDKDLSIPENYRFLYENRLNDGYNNWINRVEPEHLNRDAAILENIIRIQDQLSEYEALELSPFVIKQIILGASPSIKETVYDINNDELIETEEYKPVTPNDGIEIFNNSHPSQDVPYIQLNGPLTETLFKDDIDYKYYKVYYSNVEQSNETIVSKSKTQLIAKYKNIIPVKIKTKTPDSIISKVWIEVDREKEEKITNDKENVIKPLKTNKDSYVTVIYNLYKNKIEITNPIQEDVKTLDDSQFIANKRFERAFPMLKLGPLNQVKIVGEFNIYNLEISERSLFDLILTSEIMNMYMYIDESKNFTGSRKKAYIYYRTVSNNEKTEDTIKGERNLSNTSSIRLRINQNYTKENEEYLVKDKNKEKLANFPPNTPYITVKIMKAPNIEVVNQFMTVLSYLFSLYSKFKESIEEDYSDLIGIEDESTSEKGSEIVSPKTKVKVGQPGAPSLKGESTIYNLKTTASDIFVSGYATQCQNDRQPTLIQSDEVETYTQNNYQVLPFPKKSENVTPLNFICLHEIHPFPGVVVNKKKNKDKYPYIPCCFKKNQLKKKNYLAYYSGIPSLSKKESLPSHILGVERSLQEGRIGHLPSKIVEFLSSIGFNKEEKDSEDVPTEFIRYGVITGVNSLIHCILTAVGNATYMSMETDEKEKYAASIRGIILGTLNLSIFKQELYDYKDNEIFSQIADPYMYFDPSLYYRGLEELFQINIYVFSQNQDANESSSYIKIPRHKLFSARPLRDYLPTVLIYENIPEIYEGSPQCELIVEKNRNLRLFGPTLTQIVHKSLLFTNTTLSWNFIPAGLTNSVNMYSQYDFNSIIAYNSTHQIIDDYGKLRALIVKFNHLNFTFIFPPSQPINLPIAEGELPMIKYEQLVKIPGLENPISTTLNSKGEIDGFWYKSEIYIPIMPERNILNLPLGNPKPIITNIPTVVDQVKALRKNISILLQLIQWLFILAQIETAKNLSKDLSRSKNKILVSVSQFDETYCMVTPDYVEDDTYFYDFLQLPQNLPEMATVNDALIYLKNFVPTMVNFENNNKLVFPNEILREKVMANLSIFSEVAAPLPVPDSNWVLPIQIKGLFTEIDDFEKENHVYLFLDEKSRDLWLDSIFESNTNIIRKKIDSSLILLEDPYLFKDVDTNKIYLVQNVLGGNFFRAINVCTVWMSYRRNLGISAPPYEGTDIPIYVIYHSSPVGTLITWKDETNSFVDASTNTYSYLQLYVYSLSGSPSNYRYAALLPLI
jgi:hypothetical protein